jgi:hypothetical protein
MDLERINTVLLRQSLDGIYLSNNPRTYVHEDSIGENTIEDLLTVRPGALVRWKGGTPPFTQQDRFDASAGFQMLEYLAGVRENRTGVTRLNQGLDADSLNKTATGMAMLQATGQQVEEYLARNFANALARLFTKKARLPRRYGRPIQVPIDGEFVEVDPSTWPEEMIARPRVGLGSGRKEQRIAFRRELIGMQSAAIGAGLVGPAELYNSAKGFVADANLGDVREFFRDPSTIEASAQGEPEPPDPALVKVQAEAELKRQELAARQGEMAIRLEMDQSRQASAIDLAREKAALELQLRREKAELEADLARDRALSEAQLAQQRFEAEQALNERKLALEELKTGLVSAGSGAESEAELQKLRRGGDLDK